MKTIQQKDFTRAQHELVAEYCATYGLEPDQILFFENAANEPFFDREATAVLLHKLTDVVGIEDEPIVSLFPDNIAVSYKITFQDGTFASSTGMANLGEKRNGHEMSPEEIKSLATARAARSALVNKGINLIRLHEAAKGRGNVAEFSGPPRDNNAKLLREVHALGYETSYIVDSWFEGAKGQERFTDKAAWKRVLRARYGVDRSSDLSELQLTDFAAFLRSQLPANAVKAAA